MFPHTTTHTTHTHMLEYYLAMKNEIIPLAAIWMDLEIIIVNEISQMWKDI